MLYVNISREKVQENYEIVKLQGLNTPAGKGKRSLLLHKASFAGKWNGGGGGNFMSEMHLMMHKEQTNQWIKRKLCWSRLTQGPQSWTELVPGPILVDGLWETMYNQCFLWPKIYIKCLIWNSFRVFNIPSAMTSCSSPRNLAAWWKGSNTALWLYSAGQKPHFDCTRMQQ